MTTSVGLLGMWGSTYRLSLRLQKGYKSILSTMAGRATRTQVQQNTQRLRLPSRSPLPRTHHGTAAKETAGNPGLQRPHQPAYGSKATSEWPGQQGPEGTPWCFWAMSVHEQPWGALAVETGVEWRVGTEACPGPVRVCLQHFAHWESKVPGGWRGWGSPPAPQLSHSLRSSKALGYSVCS